MNTGCRPLSEAECERILNAFQGRYRLRDRCLFVAGTKTGFRISELLSLRVGDVFRDGAVTNEVIVQRASMKGKRKSRALPINPAFKNSITAWLEASRLTGAAHADVYLFRSQKSGAIGTMQAWSILKKAFSRAGVSGRVATHSLRKTFAARCWETSAVNRDLIKLMHLLGHENVSNTARYVQFLDSSLDAAVLSI